MKFGLYANIFNVSGSNCGSTVAGLEHLDTAPGWEADSATLFFPSRGVSNSLLECSRKLEVAVVYLAQVLQQVDQQSHPQPSNS